MTDERWTEIKALVEDKFDILSHETVDLDDAPGTREVIEFISPMGKMRFERTDQPLVTGKKVIGSKRIGSESIVEYNYSETERVHRFKVYRWMNDLPTWVEVEMEASAAIF